LIRDTFVFRRKPSNNLPTPFITKRSSFYVLLSKSALISIALSIPRTDCHAFTFLLLPPE
jgi:hypothetical protein